MSIKDFIKAHTPNFILPYLLALYRVCRVVRQTVSQRRAKHDFGRISKLIQKYLPYYQDDLSREILSDRLAYIGSHDRNIFLDRAEKIGMKFYDLPYSMSKGYSGIVLLYDNKDKNFRYTLQLLQGCGWSDRFRQMTLKEFLHGAEVSDTELLVPVLTYWGQAKFTAKLTARKIKSENIIGLPYFIREDLQYFDVFTPVDDEVVVDAGAYDGTTAIQFLEWGKGKVKHVYSFEFDPVNAAKCEENLKPYADKITLVKKGTWDKDEVIRVRASGGVGSNIGLKGNTEALLTAIDSVVQDEHVTFIKMDVEGAELKSLMGARNTIIKNHPRLAICAYHKASDLYELPEYILSLVPEYRFLLRHYSSCEFETVLYAYCE